MIGYGPKMEDMPVDESELVGTGKTSDVSATWSSQIIDTKIIGPNAANSTTKEHVFCS